MFICNLFHVIINTLKRFIIPNLPYQIAKKIEYGQTWIFPTELYYYSTTQFVIFNHEKSRRTE